MSRWQLIQKCGSQIVHATNGYHPHGIECITRTACAFDVRSAEMVRNPKGRECKRCMAILRAEGIEWPGGERP